MEWMVTIGTALRLNVSILIILVLIAWKSSLLGQNKFFCMNEARHCLL
jgi:hypothetical protein